jgi:hypothetical protein
MEILRGEGHQQNALLQLVDDLRFTAQKSLACGARLSKGRSENALSGQAASCLNRSSASLLITSSGGPLWSGGLRSICLYGLRTYTSLMGRPKNGEHRTDCTVELRLIAIMFIVQRIASAICSLGSDVYRWKPRATALGRAFLSCLRVLCADPDARRGGAFSRNRSARWRV